MVKIFFRRNKMSEKYNEYLKLLKNLIKPRFLISSLDISPTDFPKRRGYQYVLRRLIKAIQ